MTDPDTARRSAVLPLTLSIVATVFAVPAFVLAVLDVSSRALDWGVRSSTELTVKRALESDDPAQLAEAAALATAGSPAGLYLDALADASYGRTAGGMLPAVVLSPSGPSCAATAASCGDSGAFAFDGSALVSFRVADRSVSRLIIEGGSEASGSLTHLSVVSGFRSTTTAGVTLTIEVANLTAYDTAIDGVSFLSGDTPVGTIDLTNPQATAECLLSGPFPAHSLTTIVCSSTTAGVGNLVLSIGRKDGEGAELLTVPVR